MGYQRDDRRLSDSALSARKSWGDNGPAVVHGSVESRKHGSYGFAACRTHQVGGYSNCRIRALADGAFARRLCGSVVPNQRIYSSDRELRLFDSSLGHPKGGQQVLYHYSGPRSDRPGRNGRHVVFSALFSSALHVVFQEEAKSIKGFGQLLCRRKQGQCGSRGIYHGAFLLAIRAPYR